MENAECFARESELDLELDSWSSSFGPQTLKNFFKRIARPPVSNGFNRRWSGEEDEFFSQERRDTLICLQVPNFETSYTGSAMVWSKLFLF
jgi:hypothetical protein